MELRVEERSEDFVLGGGAVAGAKIEGVVGIHAVGGGFDLAIGDDAVKHREKFVFAEVAAVGIVGAVGGVVPFPGLNLDDTGADDRGNLMCRETFIRPQTWRDGEDGDERWIADVLRGRFTIESLERFQSDVHLHGRCVAVTAVSVVSNSFREMMPRPRSSRHCSRFSMARARSAS